MPHDGGGRGLGDPGGSRRPADAGPKLRLGPFPTQPPRGPFAHARPPLLLAAAYAAVAITAAVADRWLPGGRWLPLHLFTLGVLTNLVLAMSRHFAATVTHARTDGGAHLWLANVGACSVVAGMLAPLDWLVAVGATAVACAVFLNYRELRTMRRTALGARFGFVVRGYERAHGAFLHGAVLGLLMGVGAVSGPWYASVRLAHVHVNVLGWGGLTLLATIVFFGPTMLRARLQPGADALAAKALRWGATTLTVAVLALVATGAGGAVAVGARIIAALGLVGYAAATAAICVPVVRASGRAGATDLRVHVAGACTWFVAGAFGDAALVALDRADRLDLAGIALLVGGLGQAVLASFAYLTATMRGLRDTPRVPRALPVIFNLAVGVAVVAVASGGPVGAIATRVAGAALAAVVATELVVAASRILRGRAPDPTPAPTTAAKVGP